MAELEFISRYKIEKILGKGGDGTVYKAYNPALNQNVAIKVIHEHLLLQDETGEQEDIAYIIMEFIDGKQLKDYLEENYPIDVEITYKIMRQLQTALSYAHKKGIVYRDIKPANIMVLPNWHIQVADFGIAKIENLSSTQTGMIMGTLHYMSPEQCLGEKVDYRADIFSAGVVLYYLLTHKKPFDGETVMGIFQQVLNLEPLNPSMLNHQLPSSFDAVIKKALAKNPAQRFQEANEFSYALKAAVEEGKTIQFNPLAGTVLVPDLKETIHSATENQQHIPEQLTPIENKISVKSKPKSPEKKNFLGLIIGLWTLATVIVISYFLWLKQGQQISVESLLAKYLFTDLARSSNSADQIVFRGYGSEQNIQNLKSDLAKAYGENKLDTHDIKSWSGDYYRARQSDCSIESTKPQKPERVNAKDL